MRGPFDFFSFEKARLPGWGGVLSNCHVEMDSDKSRRGTGFNLFPWPLYSKSAHRGLGRSLLIVIHWLRQRTSSASKTCDKSDIAPKHNFSTIQPLKPILAKTLELCHDSDQIKHHRVHEPIHRPHQEGSSSQLIETIIEMFKCTLESSEDLLVSGFGKFQVKEKNARRGRKPANG